MTRHDIFDQPVTLPAEAVGHWNATCLAFLAHGAATPLHLAKLAEAAPGHAAPHALRGMFYMLLGRRELFEEAQVALDAARTRAEGTNARERALIDTLAALLDGHYRPAIAALEAALDRAPGDTLAMKLSHAIRFVTGDAAGMRASVERTLADHGPGHAGRGYVLGCHAFALEETGEFDRAARTGRAALQAAADDAWALHAVAHVHDMTGDAAGGLAWLDAHGDAAAGCNNFRFHIWWHRALMLLDLGRLDEALQLYDAKVRAEHTDDYRDIANATSLLTRLELEGVDVGDRWVELADLSERRTEDACLVFADLHYLLALEADGREDAAARMLGRLARCAEAPADGVEARMAQPGLDTASGIAAFAHSDYSGAFAALSRARPHLPDAGGSHAQRDVFERLAIDAGLRAGQIAGAEALLAARAARRGGHEDGYAAARRALIAQAQKPVPRAATGP
ncbi:tetratricopeptide repeat protein [Jannaschia ovalis]|uniref:Tetratricopeptide repeat protein 38 n=1 Tax=Jannaschia ovalis TaxID=3038773 RepID=A0ABY8LBX2_9RHOB|nr:tetratricopeptide repeat protein [Jannaschia sp. GRR-S6-38]WGH78631.1 tetratricopeptide repeat protein [Jannaschia sp. GRR-S6-38]